MAAKASGNAAALVSQAAEPKTVGISVGAESPAGAHTAVTELGSANGGALYKGVKAAFVRSVLPRTAEAPVALRDALDVYPASGINCDAEIAAAKASMKKTADVAVALAKSKGFSKVTVLSKNQSKYANLNALWTDVVQESAAASGVTVEVALSAPAANNLIMFPENAGVVVAADTTTAENVEAAFAGILGGVERKFYLDNGATVLGGNSVASVANAVASALSAQGLTAEAKKIQDAIAKAPSNEAALLQAV